MEKRARLTGLLVAVGVLAAIAGLVAACSPLALINTFTPADTYRAQRDIAYGTLERQRLDVYVPAHRPRDAPVILFFYGGNWNSGAKADYQFVGEAFASRGFVTVLADYRLYPQVRFPDFLRDSARAFAWVHANITNHGGNPARIFLAGHSAGAYNAAMLAFDPAYLDAAGVPPGAVRGLIGLAGPYDFIPLTGDVTKAVFGFPDTPPATQPINFVGAQTGTRLPPVLLLTAPDDTVVKQGNSARLAAKLRGAGGVVKEISYAKLDHRSIAGALAAPLRGLAPVLDDIVAFAGGVK